MQHGLAPRQNEENPRHADGSAGDADYGMISEGYSRYRRPDERILKAIEAALGNARTVINVGAGAGSYEPPGLAVTAVEPSEAMRAQRDTHLSVAIDATAEELPFADDTFDAALASFTVHQWRDLHTGLREMRRVATGPVVVLTCDPNALHRFWLQDYAPEVIAMEANRYPHIEVIAHWLDGNVNVYEIPIPLDCTDGFGEAYYGRPEALLDSGARLANSAWSLVPPDVPIQFEETLRADLESGEWDRRYGALRNTPKFWGALRLIIAQPRSRFPLG